MMFQESMTIPSLYTRDEQAIIERWMRSTPVYPDRDDLNEANGVAEIALSSVQYRLPQGLSIREDGSTTYSRRTWECPVSMRNERLFPIHLFDIDRDESQLQIVCPESCYATFLPGYDVHVVTVSQASPEAYGFFDVAVDYFQFVDDPHQIVSNAKSILKAWWKYQNKELHLHSWKSILKSGLIEADEVLSVRDQVWNRVENRDGVLY